MTGRDDSTVSRSETTEVTESHSSDLGTDTERHTRSERHEVHEEAPVRDVPEVVQTTTTTTIVEE